MNINDTYQKVVIFGTTRGLGKAFLNYISKNTENIIEINRNDWKVLGSIRGLKSKISKASLVICNSHLGFLTSNLIYELSDYFSGSPTTIIVIGSVTSDVVKDQPNIYNIEKKTIENTVKQLQLYSSKPQIILVKPGWIDSELIKDNTRARKSNKMEPNNLVSYIMSTIEESLKREFNLKSISIDNFN